MHFLSSAISSDKKSITIAPNQESYIKREQNTITDAGYKSVWNETDSSLTIHLKRKIEQLEEYFYLLSPLYQLEDYLLVYPSAFDIFLHIHRNLLDYYPSLDLYLQLDTLSRDTRYYEAIIKIKSDLDYHESYKRLEQIDNEWWLEMYEKNPEPITLALY